MASESQGPVLLILPAKLMVKKVKVDGVIQIFQQRLAWQPKDSSAAQPVTHPAASLTGATCSHKHLVTGSRPGPMMPALPSGGSPQQLLRCGEYQSWDCVRCC